MENNYGNNLKQIDNLIDIGKYEEALELIYKFYEDETKKYDTSLKNILRTKHARILTLLGKYDEAIVMYKNIDEKRIYFNLAILYLHFKNDYNIKRIYNNYFAEKNIYSDLKYMSIKLQLMNYLGIPLDSNYDLFSTFLKQDYAYSKERALDHIIRNHTLNDETKIRIEERNIFNNDVNIEELFNTVQDYIDTHDIKKHITSDKYRYQIYYPNLSINPNQKYLIVVTSIVNNGILSMYPSYQMDKTTIYLNNNTKQLKK